jgi:hypothetical protein
VDEIVAALAQEPNQRGPEADLSQLLAVEKVGSNPLLLQKRVEIVWGGVVEVLNLKTQTPQSREQAQDLMFGPTAPQRVAADEDP